MTGNPGIDAVLHVAGALERGELRSAAGLDWLDPGKKLILVTAHRRESFGDGIRKICSAIEALAARDDVQIACIPYTATPTCLGRPKAFRASGMWSFSTRWITFRLST